MTFPKSRNKRSLLLNSGYQKCHYFVISNKLLSFTIIGILIDPRNSKHIWVGLFTSGMNETWNAGDTWTPMAGDIPFTRGVTEMIWDEDRQIVYVGTNTGVFSFKQ
jgi:hypothetical protein